MKQKHVTTLPPDETRCPRCNGPTIKWTHTSGFKPKAKRGYYSVWYECASADCPTKLIMPPQHYHRPGANEMTDLDHWNHWGADDDWYVGPEPDDDVPEMVSVECADLVPLVPVGDLTDIAWGQRGSNGQRG